MRNILSLMSVNPHSHLGTLKKNVHFQSFKNLFQWKGENIPDNSFSIFHQIGHLKFGSRKQLKLKVISINRAMPYVSFTFSLLELHNTLWKTQDIILKCKHVWWISFRHLRNKTLANTKAILKLYSIYWIE